MPWYIKTEKFRPEILKIFPDKKRSCLNKHKAWVENLINSGQKVISGYLVDEKSIPGGGGLLIINAKSFETAKSIIEQDPMISEGLVEWKIQEWVVVSGEIIL